MGKPKLRHNLIPPILQASVDHPALPSFSDRHAHTRLSVTVASQPSLESHILLQTWKPNRVRPARRRATKTRHFYIRPLLAKADPRVRGRSHSAPTLSRGQSSLKSPRRRTNMLPPWPARQSYR